MEYYNTYLKSIQNNSSNGYISYPYASTSTYLAPDNTCNYSRSDEETDIKARTHEDAMLQDAINTIKKSIESEKDDEIFYEVLLSQAPNESDRNIIKSIINDEKKHRAMLKQLYIELTSNAMPTPIMSRTSSTSTEYLKNLEKALFGELEAVEKYRNVMAAMPDKRKYAMLMEIMTDELKHANKYNFLIAKNMK